MKKIFVFLLCFVLCFATLTVFIAAEEPEVDDPGASEQPGAEEPGADQPVAEDPGAEDPGAEDPGASEQPGAEDPGASEQPGADDPGVMSDVPSDAYSFSIEPGTYSFSEYDPGERFSYFVNGTLRDGSVSFVSFYIDSNVVYFFSDYGMTEEVDSYGIFVEFSVMFNDSVVYTTDDSDLAESTFFDAFPDAQPTSSSSGLIPGIFGIFTSIISWISLALTTVVSLFWANGSLTFFGLLAVVALGISLFFLLIGVCQRFLHFRS